MDIEKHAQKIITKVFRENLGNEGKVYESQKEETAISSLHLVQGGRKVNNLTCLMYENDSIHMIPA